MYCVIGSGPAGVACAKALVSRGATVAMLDAGLELEPDRAQRIGEIANNGSSGWKQSDLALVKGDMAADGTGIPLKLLFGSDFLYRETEEKIRWEGHGVGVRPSLALGGLSNVWGAAMLPYRGEDMARWPVKLSEMESHYRAAVAITGMAGWRDDLQELFPLYCDEPQPLPSSRQAELLLKNLERHRRALRQRGWYFGRGRLAVRTLDNQQGAGCTRCGLCMYGCPYRCIYNSADTVRELLAEKNFAYRRDVIISSVLEKSDKVCIAGFHRRTGESLSFEADRVFLAAGVIPTSQIILRSLSAYDQPVVLRDSQYFLVPLLLTKRTRNVQAESLHTLSQVFIEICRPQISRHAVHLQIYSYSDIIGSVLRKSLGPLKFLASQLEDRMLVVQGYLHSDESQTITMTLKRIGATDTLLLEARRNSATAKIIDQVLWEIFQQSRRLGGIILRPMLQLAVPGRGFHCGGSVPMRENPGPLQSDSLGRPSGWARIHAVDATVLPSVPATTITLSVMANAHRIGWKAAELDSK
jgi:ferredoxin